MIWFRFYLFDLEVCMMNMDERCVWKFIVVVVRGIRVVFKVVLMVVIIGIWVGENRKEFLRWRYSEVGLVVVWVFKDLIF